MSLPPRVQPPKKSGRPPPQRTHVFKATKQWSLRTVTRAHRPPTQPPRQTRQPVPLWASRTPRFNQTNQSIKSPCRSSPLHVPFFLCAVGVSKGKEKHEGGSLVSGQIQTRHLVRKGKKAGPRSLLRWLAPVISPRNSDAIMSSHPPQSPLPFLSSFLSTPARLSVSAAFSRSVGLSQSVNGTRVLSQSYY